MARKGSIVGGTDPEETMKQVPAPAMLPFRLLLFAAALLKKKDAGAYAKAGNGMTPLRLAILNGQEEMAELLKKHGARE